MTAIPAKGIKLLVQLQEKDKALDGLKVELENIPAQIQELKDALEAQKNLAVSGKESSSKLQLLKKEKELAVSEREQAIAKHQVELNQVKSNDAFKALLTEIEKAKTEKDNFETEILETLEQLDNAVLQEKMFQKEFQEAEKRTQSAVTALLAREKELEASTNSLDAERAAFLGQIPPEALVKYEYIRKQKRGLAVAAVKQRDAKEVSGAVCGGCNMALPPQAAVDIRKKDAIVICDNCQRIIYSPGFLNDPQPAEDAPSS